MALRPIQNPFLADLQFKKKRRGTQFAPLAPF